MRFPRFARIAKARVAVNSFIFYDRPCVARILPTDPDRVLEQPCLFLLRTKHPEKYPLISVPLRVLRLHNLVIIQQTIGVRGQIIIPREQ